jgi:hypothetical protein
MSHSRWNYRFCVETVPDGLGESEEVWTVREVYYNKKGKPNGFSADPMHAQGSTFVECADDLARMSEGLQGPCFRIDDNNLEELPRGERFRRTSSDQEERRR